MGQTVRWVRSVAGMRRDSRGALLIEVLIGLAILGVISVVFIGALYTSLHAARITDERSNALTLAKSQIEYVKTMPYSDADWAYLVDTSGSTYSTAPSWWATGQPAALPTEFEGYEVEVRGDSDIDIDGETGPDEGIRIITAIVRHNGEEVLRLQNYEVDR